MIMLHAPANQVSILAIHSNLNRKGKLIRVRYYESIVHGTRYYHYGSDRVNLSVQVSTENNGAPYG